MKKPEGPRYNEIADHYHDTVGDTLKDPATAALLELTGAVDGRRLLDLACGQGRIARALAGRGAVVVGVATSEASMERARATARRAVFVRALEPEPGAEWTAGRAGADAVPIYLAVRNRKREPGGAM